MAVLPGASPLQNALSQLGALPEADKAKLTKDAFDGISRQTKVPANVLMALDEDEGAGGNVQRAQQNAAQLAQIMGQGGKLEDAMLSLAGGDHDRAKRLLDRSYDIADAIYPRPKQAPEPVAPDAGGPSMLDPVRNLGVGALRAVGGGARMAGVAADEALKDMIESYGSRPAGEDRGAPVEGETFARPLGRSAQDLIQSGADAVESTVSDATRQAQQNTQVTGDLTDPSSWSMGEDPSVFGLLNNVAQGAGSMVPLLVTGSPLTAAVAGGLMAGGEGAENGRQFVIDAASTTGEDGQPEIAKLPEYQNLIAEGRSHEQATMQLARRAESEAGFRQSILGTIGGAATNRIFRGAEGWLGSGGRVARAAKKGGAGFVEEGSQEAMEGAAALSGIQSATGADLNLADESFGNFVMGGLSGAGVGAAGGLMFGVERQAQPDGSMPEEGMGAMPPDAGPLLLPPPSDPLALPPPNDGGTIFGAGRPGTPPGEFERNPESLPLPADADMAGQPAQFRPGQQNTLADGSGGGAAAAPGMGVLSPPGAAAPIQTPPAGPIDALTRTIQMPEAPPAPAPLRFPEQKPGSAIRLGDPESGLIHDAVFMGETPDGARIRIAGQEIDLSPQEFDMGRDEVARIEAAQKAQEATAKEAAKQAYRAETSKPATGTLATRAQTQTPPAPEVPETDPTAQADMLRKRLNVIDEQARAKGWDRRLTQARDRALAALREIEPEQAESNVDGYRRLMADQQTAMAEATERQDDLFRAQDTGAPLTEPARLLNEAVERSNVLSAEVGTRYAGLTKAEREELAGPREPSPVDMINVSPSQGGADLAQGNQQISQQPQAEMALTSPEGSQPGPQIENIRAKAAILRGIPEDQAPDVSGVSLRWDAKEQGFIFSRKHADKVKAWVDQAPQAALTGEIVTDAPAEGAIPVGPAPAPQTAHWWDGADAATRGLIARNAGIRAQGFPNADFSTMSEQNRAAVRDSFQRLYQGGQIDNIGTIEAPQYAIRAQQIDGAAQIEQAAAEAAPEPTEAQKDAGNYRKGHTSWNGLNLTIENAKGSERRGTDRGGKEWSVTMPAHYGYFRGTEGADGDHVDFYMGDVPNSDYVMIVDQVDAETGKFDEHKVILGTTARGTALGMYRGGFSDGRGDERIGGFTETNVATLKALLDTGIGKKPIAPMDHPFNSKRRASAAPATEQATPTPAPQPSPAVNETTKPKATGLLSSLSEADQARAAELQRLLANKVRNQASSGLDPEYITLGAELVTLYVKGGARKFGQMLRDFAAATGLTIRQAQAPMRAAYTHVRDEMDLNGEDISGMDSHAEVMAEVRAAMADESAREAAPQPAQIDVQPNAETAMVPAQPVSETAPDDNRTDDGDGRASAQEGAPDTGRRQGQAGSVRSDDRGTGGSGNRSAERQRERPEPGTDGPRSGDGASARNSDSGRTGAANHVIEPGGLELARGEKTRARESIAALRTLRTIQNEGRPATADERASLAKYGGAGTLAGTLPRSDGTIRHPDLAAEIEALTTPEERATLSRTSQYAFYTAEPALRSMWSLAQQLGFKGGRVYEPGMGVGGFAGTMPGNVSATYTGLELDHVTAQIAAALYPKHAIKNGDFIKEKLPQGYYDLVIGNPPFAGTQIRADADYPQGFMIHDYFFAKSLDAVRPGGLLMFITSAGTMNKMDSKARDYLADRADMVGAIRLPNTAFKENGTEVTTDIIVLRKRQDGEAEANPAWRKSEVVALPRDDGSMGEAAVNSYFVQHPEMILGDQGLYDTLTASDRVGVRPRENADLRADLKEAVARFPRDIMSEPSESVKLGALDAAHTEAKAGSFYLKDGELYQFDGNTGRKVDARSRENTKGMPKAAMEAVKALIPIKNALRDVYAADVDGKDASAARKELNKAYDAYVKERGPIGLQNRREQRPSVVEQETARQQAENDARAAGQRFDTGSFDAGPMIEAGASMAEIARARQAAREAGNYEEGDFDPAEMADKIITTRPNIDPFMDDPESYRLLAIERYDEKTDTATKTRVFTENAVRVSSKPQINSPEDALLHLLGETGRVDPARIAEMSGSTADRVVKELEGKIFQNPVSRDWETRAKYLSGNVVVKLEEAEREARGNPEYQANVDALRAVQPQPIAAQDIAVPLGAHWFPASVYSDFAASLGLNLTAEFKPRLGIWLVDGSTNGTTATSEWGTPDRPFGELMGLVMSNKKIEVRRTRRNSDGTTESWVDEEATQAAGDKAAALQDKFKEWFWSDEARTADMERLYNRTFNSEVAPKYDGAYLTTPGIHSDWSWRPHQTAVIARILQSGDTYMAHTVGAGKTSAMIGAGMEAKRLGLAQKPWYVVPNHMLIQFATEFYQQYPLAKVLVADERRFHTSRRKQFVADAAMGDHDAIIITHSAFKMIPASEASKKAVVEGMLDDVRDVLEGLSGGQFGEDAGMERSVLGALQSMAATLGVDVKGLTEGKTKTRKKIEALLEAAEQRMARQTTDKGKDSVFDFDETGADMLFVDEAHLFRKLSFATSLGAIKGVDPEGSQASMDLFIKTRALAQRNPGRSLVLASGTPITNTMAELYSISRYLQPQALDERNISAFDAWAATFGTTESALEQAPDGGYKLVTRFAKFVNTPELSLMVRQVMDVISGSDLEQYVTRPALKGGKRNLVVVEASPDLKAYQQQLGERMRKIEARKGPVKKGDDILLSVINDGRLAAIDMRLVDPNAGDTNSKLDRMIQNIYRRFKDGERAPLYGIKREGGYTDKPIETGPSTQIVFSTLGINPTRHNPSFAVHRFIKAQLVSMGVPADQIILAENLTSDARKQRAFNDMNEGKKRILIGSKTLFTGVNAQRRIAAIHNLDPLWFPADDEQRNGRGIRQGNMNREIEILDYSAKGTYDATMWQMMARKASFIEGFFRGDPDVRDMEDLGEASQYEQAKAMSTADPRVLQLTEMRAERDKLVRRAGAATRERQQMEAKIRNLRRGIEINKDELTFWEGQAAKVQNLAGESFEARAGGKTYTERKDFGADLISAAEDALAGDGFKTGDKVGTVSGFPLMIDVSKAMESVAYYLQLPRDTDVMAGFSEDPIGMARKIEGALSKISNAPARVKSDIADQERSLADTESGLAKLKGFADQEALDALYDQVAELEGELLSEASIPDGEKQQRDMSEPVATLTGDELGPWSDMRQLARKAEAWYRNNLLPNAADPAIPPVTVTNEQTGWVISFNRRGQKKTINAKNDVVYRAVVALPDILRAGRLINSQPDRRARAEVKMMHIIEAPISFEGRSIALRATIAERTDGTFHYDLSIGREARGFSSSTAREQSRASAEQGDPAGDNVTPASASVNPNGRGDGAQTNGPMDARENRVEPDRQLSAADWNISLVGPDINGVMHQDLRTISADLKRMVADHGLSGTISPRLVRGLLSSAGIEVLGTARGSEVQINVAAANPAHVLRHEIVHVLRNGSLWGNDHGLFTKAEWQALVRAARADTRLRAAVERAYPDLDTTGQTEEMVAEFYADWATARAENPPGALGAALERIQSFLRALGSALRGHGFNDAAAIMRRIADGTVGGRGPEGGPGAGRNRNSDIGGEVKEQRDMTQLKERLSRSGARAKGMISDLHWKRTPQALSQLWSNALTDAMGRNERFNLLGAVPGRPLFTELGKNLPAAQEYLGLKERMDAERNDWQALSASTVDKWTSIARKHPEANERLMELMHDTTIAQIDPSKDDGWKHPADEEARAALNSKAASKDRKDWAKGILEDAKAREAEFPSLQARFNRLPKPLRDMYAEIRDSYSKLADAEEEAVVENIRQGVKATLEQARRDAKRERQRIQDEMPAGSRERNEAMGRVNEKLSAAEARAQRSSGPWIRQLRQAFESNRVAGPYFPLSRQGQYFAAVRDQEGNLIEFQRFEAEAEQQRFAEQARKDNPGYRVKTGVVDNGDQAREAGDPRFVADIEKLLEESGASREAMDAVWQRYLETMPGQSMRKNRIHRKGTRGYNKDAIRAFASGMFHGAHQVARLRFGTQMTEALAVAKEQAAEQKDANRAGFVVREMEKRHAFTMQPTNNPLVTAATSVAFVWYLGMSPAAALVNLSQTTVVGIPLMRAHFKKAGTDGVIKALTKASHDFVKGRGKVTKRAGGVPVMSDTWSVENSPSLTADERKAMQEGYERGVIDKTQAHDLAAVAESGVKYNPTREKIMRVIGWGFHHTERFNREVTYLAAYRLARAEGMDHDAAARDAGRVTWNVHFDYSNTSRPRYMQADTMKVLLIFRNFTVNMLYRLFRDTHQALVGASKEERAEARAQLVGISLSMFAHAGIRGVWGYGLLTMLIGAFFGGDGDDPDEWLQDALLIEGDSAGVAAWNWIMGLALNGAPGHVTGMNLTERVGMPNLWFRGTDRELEGQDWWAHYMGEMAGPLFSIPGNALVGAGQMMEGHTLRGLEKMVPSFMRNPIKTARYGSEGVTTMNGDQLVEDLNPWEMFMQANGFSPAVVAERYQINNRLKAREKSIADDRKNIMREIGDAVRGGNAIPEAAIDRMRAFNRDYPEWAITADGIRQSMRSRARASQRNEFGVSLNPKINDRLRAERAPALYN